MPVFQNTYRKLDRDTAYNKVDNQSMYDCRNFRITSNDASRNAALSSVKGNLALTGTFSSRGYASDSVIGSKKIRDNMIIFTTDNDSAIPSSSAGRIWKAPLSNDNIVMNDIQLLYNGVLNFSKQHPIEDIVTFYENEDIEKIYWTDNYNNLQYANVAKYLTSNGLVYGGGNSYNDPDSFNIVQKMDLAIPTFEQILNGNIPVGMVQYAYRLYKLNGPTSNFSPASQMIPLTDSSMSFQYTTLFKGSDRLTSTGSAKSSGKSIMMKIVGVDMDYDRIEIVAIHYSALNEEPKIYIVDVKPTATTIYFTDDGSYTLGSYSLAEYNLINNPFKCKTLGSKYNILFAGNIEQNEFDFDYDARAYRWTSGRFCQLYELNGEYWYNSASAGSLWIHYNSSGTSMGNVTGMANLPTDIDAINKGYDMSSAAYHTWKFQSNGTTEGGEGPNVKYSFAVSDTLYTDKRQIDGLGTTVHMTFGGRSTSSPYYYSSSESPYTNQETRTFARDEVYRVGLVGYDDKGRHSPVKWIGDIMIPSNISIPFVAGTNGNMYSQPVMITFTINNLPSTVKYVQIVAVKRTDNEKSVKFQGILNFVKVKDASCYIMRPSESSIAGYATVPAQSPEYVNRHMVMFSPEISFYKNFNQATSDYLEILGSFAGDVQNPNANFESVKYHTYSPIVSKFISITEARIYNTTITPDAEPVQESFSTLSYPFVPRIAYYSGSHAYYGNLGTCVMLKLSAAINTSGLTAGYMLVNYRTNKYGSQYGGNTYEDRTRNEYIPAGGIVLVSAGSATVKAKQGDCYIAYADELACYYNDFYTSYTYAHVFNSVEMFPVETTVNLAYRIDDCWHRIYQQTPEAYFIREVGNDSFTVSGTKYEPKWSDLYLENTVYKRLADAKKFYPAPLDYNPEYKNDTLVMASSMKQGNETIDPWTQWATNETINVDKQYGPVNKLMAWKNYLLYWQTDAVGVLSVLDRSVVSDQQGRSVSIGEGTILQRYDNISTNIGLNTRFSITESPNGIYWYDHKRRQINRFLNNIEDMSTIRGVNSYFTSFDNTYSTYDNVISSTLTGKGFFMSYNPIYKEIWFTVKDSTSVGLSLIYNEVVDAFTGFVDTKGYYFMNFDNKFFSVYNGTIYKEDLGFPGYFYGTYYDAYVTVVVNPLPNMAVTFTNYEISSEVYTAAMAQVHTRTIDKLQVTNDYQDTTLLTLSSTNMRRLLRTWRLDGGRNSTDNARIRDTYAKVHLRFVNDSNHHNIVLHDLVSLYMVPAESVANKMTQK